MADDIAVFGGEKRPENVKMLQRVMMKLRKDQQMPVDHEIDYIDKAAHYTGLQKKVLEDLKNNETYNFEFKAIDRSVIYEALTSFYLDEKIIPTTRQLFEALYNKIPAYVDIRTFRKTLVKMGFVWQRLTGYDVVVIEKPTVIFERYEYVKNIINYRSEGKPIYFVDENALELKSDYFTLDESMLFEKSSDVTLQKVIYAVSKAGVHSIKYIDNFDERTFTNWFLSDFLPTLKDPSVIVFNQAKHHCAKVVEPPNQESLKFEICQWLEHHKVPFETGMSKYQLLSLTKNYTDVDENMYCVDRILMKNGHIPLRIPNCINKLTPAAILCNLIKENRKQFFTEDEWSQTAFAEAVDSIPEEIFAKYDEYIATLVVDIFMKDTEIDKVFDDLLKNMRQHPLSGEEYSDIPSYSDSDSESCAD